MSPKEFQADILKFNNGKENLLPQPPAPILEKLVQGDKEAFSQLVIFYNESLFRWLVRLTNESHAAEDLVQDTFVRAFQAVGRLRLDSNLKAWLFRIAHNGYANWVRNRKGRNSVLPIDVQDKRAGPIEQLNNQELTKKLAEAIDKLPEEWKVALLLRTREEMAFREMALVLSTTEETARWRVFKARQKLMEILENIREDLK